jgi:hypothetical protein
MRADKPFGELLAHRFVLHGVTMMVGHGTTESWKKAMATA